MNNQVSENPQVSMVPTFHELINTPFLQTVNAICWQRNLVGDFREIVSKLELRDDLTNVSVDELLNLSLTDNGELARNIILEDLRLLSDAGASPSLNLIKNYERDTGLDFISTDVYSYHVDRSPVETATFLCTYYGATSDILPNDQADQKILNPEIRLKLKQLYDGAEIGFENFLSENFFDLHYLQKPGANPYNLGLGNLWKLAVDHPGQVVLPCIHRAPIENHGEYRLLLIC